MEINCLKRVEYSTSYFSCAPHIEIASRLCIWKCNALPSLNNESVGGYGDLQIRCDCLLPISDKIKYHLNNISGCCENYNSDISEVTECLRLLTPHGIQHLLGMRHTTGSIDVLYPPRVLLIEQFQLLHSPKAKLTVGARALSKHCIRCKQTWGELTGPEIVQNDIALSSLYRVLEHCCWINIHTLPHDEVALEIRIKEGFGVRWSLQYSIFRGFVEPYIENGHEQHWIHNSQ